MASLPYPRTPLSPRLHLSFFRFTLFFPLVHPISFPLHTPYFCHPHRPTRMLVTVDADARIDRRGCSYRPTRMLVTTDADARIGRRGCSYRPTRMTFVDVSQCQTFTFVLPNLYFQTIKLLLSCSQIVALWLKTSLFTFYTLFFLQYLPLFSSISSAFLLSASSGCSP